jgi:hypothetical protein
MSNQTDLIGWDSFFDELLRFINLSVRSYESANEAYATHVIDRLEVCLISLQDIKVALSTNTSLNHIRATLEEISGICRVLSRAWENKLDESTGWANIPPIRN